LVIHPKADQTQIQSDFDPKKLMHVNQKTFSEEMISTFKGWRDNLLSPVKNVKSARARKKKGKTASERSSKDKSSRRKKAGSIRDKSKKGSDKSNKSSRRKKLKSVASAPISVNKSGSKEQKVSKKK
jgi:hypothetical protein